jgi:trigger factor
MEVKIKDLEKSQKQIEVEISKEEFDGFIEKAYKKAGANMEMKGFRKGNVPRDIIEKHIGKEGILVEAGDLAVQETYKRIVLENKLEPITPPEVKIKKIAVGSSMIFEAVFSVLPEVGLPDYRKIAKKLFANRKDKKEEVKDAEVEGALKWIQRSRAKFSIKNDSAKKGDFVEIEYSSPDIPELGKDSVKKDAFILGEGHFIPGFEDIIEGMKSSEEKNNVKIKIPKEHSFKKIAGKEVSFNIKVNSVQNVEFPEISDEFAKTVGNFDGLDALKSSIIKGILQEKEMAGKQKSRNELLQEIADNSNLEIPDILIERESESMLKDFGKEADDNLKKMARTQAEAKVKKFLVLREIGKKENIEVSEQEIKEENDKILKSYSRAGQADIDPIQLRDYTREVIRTEKIFNLLESFLNK